MYKCFFSQTSNKPANTCRFRRCFPDHPSITGAQCSGSRSHLGAEKGWNNWRIFWFSPHAIIFWLRLTSRGRFILLVQLWLASSGSSLQPQCAGLSMPRRCSWFMPGSVQFGRLLEGLFTNDQTIKTGSHISSQRLYFFEKLRLSGGDGWGFKVTTVFYDCYWMEHIFNKCPRHPACVVDPHPLPPSCPPPAPTTSFSLSLHKMDVCVCGLWQSNVSWHTSWVY